MKFPRLLALSVLWAACCFSAAAADRPRLVLASGQGHPAVVDRVSGRWDSGGRIVLEGLYRPESLGSAPGRNMVWAGQIEGPFTELTGDGHDVPYFGFGVGGTVPKLSVPRTQAVFNGYEVPARYRAYVSRVAPIPPNLESEVIWVQDLERPPTITPTIFIVNDLETHRDGTDLFTRPSLRNVVVRTRSSVAGLEPGSYVATEGGGGLQLYLNSSISDTTGQKGGSLVWLSRHDQAPVASGPSNVVQALAASAGLQLGLPGAQYLSLDVLGTDLQERLLWQASKAEGTHVLRGDAGVWTTLLAPGSAAPPARGTAPAPGTTLGQVGTVGLIDRGAAFFAEAHYATAAGDMSGRSALLQHDGTDLKLFAFEDELLEGDEAGVRLGKFTPTGYSWPDANSGAFYGAVRGGADPFLSNQGLVLAQESGVWLLARQGQTLPVPLPGTYLLQFRFAVLAARPDRTVVFGARVELPSGDIREVLYSVTPGRPNRYEVLLEAGTAITVPTMAGDTVGIIRSFDTAQWKPGTFDQLLVNVSFTNPDTTAVLVLGGSAGTATLRAGAGPGGLRLAWPASLGTNLESALAPGGGAWADSGAVIIRVGDEFTAEIPFTSQARFFRIRTSP